MKLLSLLTAAAMLFSAAVMTVGAEPETVPASNTYSGEPDTSWLDLGNIPADKTWTLTTADQLAGLAEICSDNTKIQEISWFEECTIKLGADIVWYDGDASEWTDPLKAPSVRYMWTPIQQFLGTFDGQGHIVSGIYVDNQSFNDGTGFFGRISYGRTCVIKNLAIVNSFFYGGQNTGGLIGEIDNYHVEIENVLVDAIVGLKPTGFAAGGFIGMVYGNGKRPDAVANPSIDNVTVKNCAFFGEVRGGKDGIGGCVGDALNTTSTIEIENFVFGGKVSHHESAESAVHMGGLFGAVVHGVPLTLKNILYMGETGTPDGAVASVGAFSGQYAGGQNATYDGFLISSASNAKNLDGNATESGNVLKLAEGGAVAREVSPDDLKTPQYQGWVAVPAFNCSMPASLASIASKGYPVVKEEESDTSETEAGTEAKDNGDATEANPKSEEKGTGEKTEKPASGGCGSTVGMSIGLILAIGSACAVLEKKRK